MQKQISIDAKEYHERAVLRSASLGDSVPTRVKLAPWGKVETTNGTFIVDEESVQLATAAFAEHGTDLPIDYEHQTLGGTYSSPSGQAPAAGWIKRLLAEPGVGLMAEIEWTESAKTMLAAKQYRFLSPVAVVRKSDRKLIALHSAALTNKPAIVGMEPIVATNREYDEAASGVHSGTPNVIHDGPCNETYDKTNDESSNEVLEILRGELGLSSDAMADEVLIAAGQRIKQLDEEAKQRRVEQRIREAMRAGKLVEAQRSWAEALVAREEDLFDEWLRTTPIMFVRGRTHPPTGNDNTSRQQAVAAKARAEFRSHRLLAGLTTEEAYVTDALRQAREVFN